jgi:hypothetical protein
MHGLRAGVFHPLAPDNDFSTIHAIGPDHRTQQFGAPRSQHASDAQDFAFVQLERHVPEQV